MFSIPPKANFNFWVTCIVSSANVVNLDQSKILVFGKECILPLKENKIPDLSQLKNTLRITKNCVTKTMEFTIERVDKIVRKGENAGCQHFLVFPQCFQKHYSKVLLAFWTACLTLSQTTNFRLFQTEWVCTKQFQIWRKYQKFIETGRKRCGKRINCSLRAIYPFPTVFSKDSFCRHVKTRACLAKG